MISGLKLQVEDRISPLSIMDPRSISHRVSNDDPMLSNSDFSPANCAIPRAMKPPLNDKEDQEVPKVACRCPHGVYKDGSPGSESARQITHTSTNCIKLSSYPYGFLILMERYSRPHGTWDAQRSGQ